MGEGMMMALLILFVFFVVLPMFVLPQIRRENKWDEERMIHPQKNRMAQAYGEAGNKYKRDF